MRDTLTLAIGPIEENTTFGGVDFLVTVWVNGAELAEWLDIHEFFDSLRLLDKPFPKRTKTNKTPVMTATRFPLFNCSCGCFGCGGYHVDVSVTQEAMIWENSDNTAALDLRPWEKGRFSFSWENVQQVIGELIAAIYNAIPKSETGEVRCNSTGDDLATRLPYFLERYNALTPLAKSAV